MADEETATLLYNWGFTEYKETFAENGIDRDALNLLGKNEVKELIPIMGPRLKFMACLTDYQKSIKDSQNTTYDTTDISNMDITYEDIQNTSTCTDDIISSHSSNDKFEIIQSSEQSEAGIAFLAASDQHNAFKGAENFERACRKAYNLNLRKFLEMTDAGNYVLRHFEKEKVLARKARSVLVDVLINGLMSESKGGLKSIDFDIISDKIIELFPNENKSTYYIQRVQGNSLLKVKPINSKGKLVDKYRNLRKLYNNKIVPPERSSSIVTDQMTESVAFLKHYHEPWDIVQQHWAKTYALRRNSKVSTVSEFLEEWPILKNKQAHLLIEEDFKTMFPNKSMNLYKNWDTFFNKLILINSKKNVDKHTEEWLEKIKESNTEDEKLVLQIWSLSGLFPPKGRLRSWKFSISESHSSILVHLKGQADIEPFIENRKKEYKQKGCKVQPYMIVVGSTLKELDSYLIIDSHIYKCDTTIKCFDLAFKAFYILNAEFPPQSEHIWLLIQRVVYNITTKFDKKLPCVETLISDILEN